MVLTSLIPKTRNSKGAVENLPRARGYKSSDGWVIAIIRHDLRRGYGQPCRQVLCRRESVLTGSSRTTSRQRAHLPIPRNRPLVREAAECSFVCETVVVQRGAVWSADAVDALFVVAVMGALNMLGVFRL